MPSGQSERNVEDSDVLFLIIQSDTVKAALRSGSIGTFAGLSTAEPAGPDTEENLPRDTCPLIAGGHSRAARVSCHVFSIRFQHAKFQIRDDR